MVIDPFVSLHQVGENDNGTIDVFAKEWAGQANRCNCAIELVHHTRKTNGDDVTTKSGRGPIALLAAARSGRVLNKMAYSMKAEAGILDDLHPISQGQSGPCLEASMGGMASVNLENGDSVGVAEVWNWPGTFDGIGVEDLMRVQTEIDGGYLRFTDQVK